MMVAHDTCVIVCWQTAVVLAVPEVVGLARLCIRANKVVRDRTERLFCSAIYVLSMSCLYTLYYPKRVHM